MGSLFTKIFLAFWLTAVLLGGALWMATRSLGDDVLTEAQSRLHAHAETAANIYQERGVTALAPWLRSVQRPGTPPLLLLDEHGRSPLEQRIPPRLGHRLAQLELDEGVQYLERGHYLVIAEVDHTDPDYYLAITVDLGHLHGLSPWARIAIALLISALVSIGLASLLTRPIRRLRGAAQAMAEGRLDIRVGGHGRDEVAELARDFDRMAERLGDMLESQRRLLRDVSHELRSPLARLRVALELLERSDDRERALQRIGKEADELEALVSNLLSLSRLESGQAALERRPVELLPLLQSVVSDAEFEAAAQGRHVSLQGTTALSLHGDPVLLRSAIENVVRNAIRFTPKGSGVEVTLNAGATAAIITICDHGSGVPEAELSHIFDAFTRIDSSRERGRGGFGLGLAITGQAIAAHGGSVSAQNRVEGGLCVTLTLPSSPAED